MSRGRANEHNEMSTRRAQIGRWRRRLSAPSIIEQVIAGVIVTVIAGSVGLAAGVASKGLFRNDSRNVRSQPATSSSVQPTVASASSTIAQPSTTIASSTTLRPVEPPVRVLSVTLERGDEVGETYVFSRQINLSSAELRELNRIESRYGHAPEYHQWFRSRGGVDPWQSQMKVVLEGNRSHQVRIIGMWAVKRCRPPLTGTIFFSPPAGADNVEFMAFDLDSTDLNARLYDSQKFPSLSKSSYFTRKTISLKAGEQQVLQIKAFTVKQYCEYRLKMAVLDGEKTIYQIIDDHGRLFRVTRAYVLDNDMPDFSRYRAVYLGGVVSPAGRGFVRQDSPSTG